MMEKKVAVIIPAYNAEKTISFTIRKLNKVKNYYHQVIIVNDGSTDNSRELFKKKLSTLNKKVLFISHKKNYGYGGAQKTLFNHFLKTSCSIAVLLHADGQYPFENINEIVKPIIENKAGIVLGSRFKGNPIKNGMPAYKYLGNRVLTYLENFILRTKFSEFHTGFRAYSKEVIKSIDYNSFSNYYDFDSQILFKCISKGYKIDEILINAKYGEEISYLNPLKYGFRILKDLFSHLIDFKKIKIQK